MPHRNKLLLKRLSESDLTFFEFHYRRAESKQKGINLNADVFVNELYPALPDYAETRAWKIPLDLWILGPGGRPPINLQRKIIKGAKYKNWRLNGEMVTEAETGEGRFEALTKGDVVVMSFEGDIAPESSHFLFLARSEGADTEIVGALETILGKRRMAAFDVEAIDSHLRDSGTHVPDEHPLAGLLGGPELELVVAGDPDSIEKVRKRNRAKLTWHELLKTRRDIELIGRRGEELVDAWLSEQVEAGTIDSFCWTSDQDALAPWDFLIRNNERSIYVDVKTTTGAFEQRLHVSLNELRAMASVDDYRIYRVHNISENRASLRVLRNLKPFANTVLQTLDGLPDTAQVPSVICDPTSIGEVDENICELGITAINEEE